MIKKEEKEFLNNIMVISKNYLYLDIWENIKMTKWKAGESLYI